ncbi:MFS transporter [Megasphaera sp. WILCCON 0056]|uniref:MFS transporter n=1 Tax=Megasphaera sp. WILCCON 0056 TaxID=3345340 RepID=UPI003A7FE882
MKSMNRVTFALFALATTFFGIGITEFIGVGVLPLVAGEFNVSTSTAGEIVSLYALGVAIGGVILTSLTARIDKKRVVLASIFLFIIGHLFTGMATSFPMLLAGRIVSASAHGLFFSLASSIAVSLVAPEKAASAIAFIFGGFTVATAFAAPLGTYISGIFGWRIPFFAIAAIGLIAYGLNHAAIPAQEQAKEKPATLRAQLRLVTHPHVLLMLAVTILGYGSTFASFTYLSPILQHITGISAESVSAVLVLYGVTIAIGNYVGGRLGNGHPLKSLTGIFLAQGLMFLGFYLAVPYTLPGIAAIAGMGLLAFMSIPALQSYVMLLAKRHVPEAMDLASALNIASFNGGIFVGAGLGGLAIDNIGLSATPLVAAVMVFLALGLVRISVWMDKREVSGAAQKAGRISYATSD